MALIDSIGFRYISLDSCNVFISALELSTFIFISYFIHLSIDFLPLTPEVVRPHRLGNTFPIFFPLGFWVFGFSYQAAHVNSLA